MRRGVFPILVLGCLLALTVPAVGQDPQPGEVEWAITIDGDIPDSTDHIGFLIDESMDRVHAVVPAMTPSSATDTRPDSETWK